MSKEILLLMFEPSIIFYFISLPATIQKMKNVKTKNMIDCEIIIRQTSSKPAKKPNLSIQLCNKNYD